MIDDLVRQYVSWKGKIGRFEFILKSGTASLKDIFRYDGLMKKLNDYIYQQEEKRNNGAFPDALGNESLTGSSFLNDLSEARMVEA